jgi:hypothetical protein
MANPPYIGSIMTITVTGQTGIIGNPNFPHIFSTSPDGYTTWRADVFELYHSEITFSDGTTLIDDLYHEFPNNNNRTYTAVFYFVVKGTFNIQLNFLPT